MRVAYCSDLHLEFDLGVSLPQYESLKLLDGLKNEYEADILILAGDIFPIADAVEGKFDNFLNAVSNNFHFVIYIAGNHEYYKWDIKKIQALKDHLVKWENIYFLDNEFIEYEGVTFFGATLWTDLNKGDFETLISVSKSMNDYRVIKNGSKKLSPEHTILEHQHSLSCLKSVVSGGQPTVIVTHHAPTSKSISPIYWNTYNRNNFCYFSDLEDIMLDNENVLCWVHGHTHSPQEYDINKSVVLCNPRGYLSVEDNPEVFELKFFEIVDNNGTKTIERKHHNAAMGKTRQHNKHT